MNPFVIILLVLYDIYISSSSPSRIISWPLPSYIPKAATPPNALTMATPHHPQATMPISKPYPYHHPPKTGPTVRNMAETLWPRPWIVPRTLGCGLQLFRRMILAGMVKVRAVTCRNKTNVMPSQTMGPDAASGGAVHEGRIASVGAIK